MTRLREMEAKNKLVSAILSYPPETMAEAERRADEILAALPQTEVSEAVREALEPFAKIAEEINKDYHDSRQIYQYGDLRLYGADFRRARQALAPPADNTSGESDG